MNQQEQATQHAAIFQDTINGTNDPTPWPVTMWASSGDTIWTAGTARTAGEDSVGMIYDPGDTIVHRNTIAGDVTRATESFAIRPADGQSPMDAMLAGIEQWNHRHPDRWDTVATPGQYRMTDPTARPAAPYGMERQPRRRRVRGGTARPRPAPGQPHAERGRARAAPLRVLPGG